MPRRKKKEEAVPEEEPAPQVEEAPAEVSEEPWPELPTAEERRVAAFAHGGILLNLITGIGGPVLALILWLLYDRKSEYASWHALQALVFQVLTMLVMAIVGGITVVLWIITVPLLFIYIGFCLLPFALGFSLISTVVAVGSLIYGCAGALAVLDGRDFRYRWIADWIPPLRGP